MSRIENINHGIEAFKNIVLIIFYSVIAWYVIADGIPFIKKEMADRRYSWHLAGFEFGPIKIERALDSVNTEARTVNKKAKDVKVDLPSIPIANYLNKSLGGQLPGVWVYIGQKSLSGNWIMKNFKDSPNKQILIALGDVYKRNNLPVKKPNGDWVLGDIVGLAHAGETLRLEKDTIIEDNNLWALVH